MGWWKKFKFWRRRRNTSLKDQKHAANIFQGSLSTDTLSSSFSNLVGSEVSSCDVSIWDEWQDFFNQSCDASTQVESQDFNLSCDGSTQVESQDFNLSCNASTQVESQDFNLSCDASTEVEENLSGDAVVQTENSYEPEHKPPSSMWQKVFLVMVGVGLYVAASVVMNFSPLEVVVDIDYC